MQIGIEEHVFGSGALEHCFFALLCVCLHQLFWPIDAKNLTNRICNPKVLQTQRWNVKTVFFLNHTCMVFSILRKKSTL